MMIICAAIEEQNLAHRYSVKSRFSRTANPPATPLELKGQRICKRHHSQPEFTQRRVVVGPTSQRPVIAAIAFRNRQIIDAGDAQSHEPVLVELPVFIAIAAKPMAAVVVPLVG